MEEDKNDDSDSSSFVQVGGSEEKSSRRSSLKKGKTGKNGKSSRASSKSGSSFHITGSEVESIVPDAQDAQSFEIQSYRSSEGRVPDFHKYELGEKQKKDILSGIMREFHFNEQPCAEDDMYFEATSEKARYSDAAPKAVVPSKKLKDLRQLEQ
jgi:hypothetical protein